MSGSGVKFTGSHTGSTEDGYAWAWVTGRIDLSTYIHLEPADGRYVVPITTILEAIAEMAEAVASPAYREVFGARGWRLVRRFDWFIGVGGELLREDGCTVHGMISTSPSGRSGRRSPVPVLPAGRLRGRRLRSWNPRRPIGGLLKAFLEDFLQTNGYHDIDATITDTLVAFEAGREMSRTASIHGASSRTSGEPGPDRWQINRCVSSTPRHRPPASRHSGTSRRCGRAPDTRLRGCGWLGSVHAS